MRKRIANPSADSLEAMNELGGFPRRYDRQGSRCPVASVCQYRTEPDGSLIVDDETQERLQRPEDRAKVEPAKLAALDEQLENAADIEATAVTATRTP